MAIKYHISDDGMPGKCSAKSSDSCPKTQAGDSFHGNLEEATQESQKRFEEKLGAFTTTTKAEEKKTAFKEKYDGLSSAELREELEIFREESPADDPTDLEIAVIDAEEREEREAKAEAAKAARAAKPKLETYRHPQGKIITIDANGNVRASKDGKEMPTSATAAKLRAGYGQWKRDDSAAPDEAAAPTPKAEAPAAPKLTPAERMRLVDDYDRIVNDKREAEENLKAMGKRHRDYDKLNAGKEGRLYHQVYDSKTREFTKVAGPSPQKNGYTGTTPLPAHEAAYKEAFEKWRGKVDASTAKQTELEEAGLGHRIPDEGNTVRVRTQAQKWLLKDELQGQISDGKWENTANNPWEDWSNAKVIVDPKNPGRNFSTRKDNYQLNSSDLLESVGDRMQENVQTKTKNPDYSEQKMRDDLTDLRRIFKTQRGQITGDE